MPSRSLLDFAQAPDTADFLPPLAQRFKVLEYGLTTNGGWPVGLLPLDALSADLARRGLRYRRSVGFTIDGESVDGHRIASLAAAVLREAAEALPPPRRVQIESATRELRATISQARAELLARFDAAPTLLEQNPDLLRTEMEKATALPRRLLAELRQETIDSAEALAAEPDWRAYAAALRHTAADVLTSQRAARILGAALRSYVPAPEQDPEEEAAALAFLASLDARPSLRRSELGALYAEAGSPGALALSALRTLAAERWGAPVKSHGHYLYRPAHATAA